MPTMYTNKLKVSGDAENIKKFAKEHFTQEPYFELGNLCPVSSDGTDYEQREERYEKWGCKYAYLVAYELGEDLIEVELEAANGAIVPWVHTVSKIFPNLEFNLDWDGGVEEGLLIVKNGKGIIYEY